MLFAASMITSQALPGSMVGLAGAGERMFQSARLCLNDVGVHLGLGAEGVHEGDSRVIALPESARELDEILSEPSSPSLATKIWPPGNEPVEERRTTSIRVVN